MFRLAVASIIVFALIGACAAPLYAAREQTVTVNLRTTLIKSYWGPGIQWDPYEYPPSEAAWKTTLARLDYMRPALFRVMLNASSYFRGSDDSGNPRYVWSAGESGMDRLTWLLRILDYAQSRGVEVLLGEWSPARGLTDRNGRIGVADPRWARIHADFVNYLTKEKKYTVIKYFNFMNEPNGSWMWPGGTVDYAAWATGIRNLRKELDARGLRWLKIAGPDNSGNWDWIDRCARELADQFDAWEMHWYARDKEVVGGEIEKLLSTKRAMLMKVDPRAASKPIFMGEAGMIDGKTNGDQQPRVKEFVYGVLMADYLAQVARAGWLGAIAWDLDDALHVNTGPRASPPTDRTLKIWGFWNTQGTAMGRPEDEAMRPWFYTWSLMARLFPKGSRIVATKDAPEIPGVRTLAAAWKKGSTQHLSVMLVNDTDEPLALTVQVPRGSRRELVSYRYFASERPVDKNGYPVPRENLPRTDLANGVRVDLPSRGVVFLTTDAAR